MSGMNKSGFPPVRFMLPDMLVKTARSYTRITVMSTGKYPVSRTISMFSPVIISDRDNVGFI